MIVLRAFDESMIEEGVKLFRHTFSKEPWHDHNTYDDVKNLFTNHMNNNYFLAYSLFENEKLIGLSIGFKKPWIKGMEYYIDQFVIHFDYQKKGFGSRFIKLIQADIEKKGINAIILNTERGYPSHSFYIKNGFKELEGLIILAK